MEGYSEEAKISCLYLWVNVDGLEKIENWKASGHLVTREEFEKLSEQNHTLHS